MRNQNRVTFYFDKLDKRVESASTFLSRNGHMPFYKPDRYKFIGRWYYHENWPYINKNDEIVRMRYGKEVIV